MTSDGDARFGLRERTKPFVRAGVVLGIGLGGFFDGIVLHQLLQWHHMLSARTDPTVLSDLRLNVVADGLFDVGTYLFTVAGIVLLIRAWRRSDGSPSGRALLGSTILGWGVFNLLEGLVNHHLLEIHHVWPAGPGSVLLWDVGFLLWGVLFVAGGYAVIRLDERSIAGSRGERATDDRPT
ncbi:DUF2243 domain-containing protein [Natronococcus jeotgali]|uniref:DUF2243 domain-containing protein n=1 Tax=Natronococcus jeotgali DSM 18795 TaxID=1227498 RepID=L9XHZ3_9EURY|nr:DUF2243 domain-containing protein [Natronococcus jeotgali]ELY61006.1 hypothetical protein C492_09700 [Natronococcus jeotgali DSM 18795]